MKMNELEKTIESKQNRVEELKNLSVNENVQEEINALEKEIVDHLSELEVKKIDEEISAIDQSLPLKETIDRVLKKETGLENGIKDIEEGSDELEEILAELEGIEGDSLEEGIQKEIDPLLKILCPEGKDYSAYREEILNDLSDSVMTLSNVPGRGLVIIPPERLVIEMKQLLINRLKTVVADAADYEKQATMDGELVRHAKIALLSMGDLSDLKRSKGKEEFAKEALDFSDIRWYLCGGNDKIKFTEKEFNELVEAGFGDQLAKIPNYRFGEDLASVPESLLVPMIRYHQDGFWINTLLQRHSPKDKYSHGVFRELTKNNMGYVVLNNFDKFKGVDFQEVVDVHSPGYPYHARDIIEVLKSLKLPQDEFDVQLDYVTKHQEMTDRDYTLPEVEKNYTDVIAKMKAITRDHYDPELRKWVKPDIGEGLSIAKEMIEAGQLGFLYEGHDYVKKLVVEDYDWLLENVKKYDQEHLLMHYNQWLKESDQREYAKKLLSQGKEPLLVAGCGTRHGNPALFSRGVLDQEVFNGLWAKDLTVDLELFQNLDDDAFKRVQEKMPELFEGKQLVRSLKSFQLENVDENKRFIDYKTILSNESIEDFMLSQKDNQIIPLLDRFLAYNPDQREAYLNIFVAINETPSQEVKRIRNEILDQVLDSQDPFSTYQKIESVFIENNLPMSGKVLKIFDVLHSDERITQSLNSAKETSRVLRDAKESERREIMAKDIVKIHVESGNKSLEKYIVIIKEGQTIIDKAESLGWETLTYEELQKAAFVFKKMQTFYENSVLKGDENSLDQEQSLNESYLQLRKNLQVSESQKISEKISELFVRPVGYETFDEVLERMNTSRKAATERNKEFATKIKEGESVVTGGDLLKGVNSEYFKNILQNGSVAVEFLGGGATKDYTPFDTDLSMVETQDLDNGFESAVNASLAERYGDTILGFKNRGQFYDTSFQQNVLYNKDLYELFKLEYAGAKHYGIRTGIPSTEIDFIYAKTPAKEKELKFEIAKNAFYIPIINKEGVVVYSPEDYDTLRMVFAGVGEYGGDPIKVDRVQSGILRSEVDRVREESKNGEEQIKNIGLTLRTQVIDVLQKQGLHFRHEFNNSILGTEFHDTGSTSRLTNLPNKFDFDFGLRLDSFQVKNTENYVSVLKEAIKGKKVAVEAHKDGYYQLRAEGVTEINRVLLSEEVDLDVGFGSKSDEVVFGSHDAISEKLASIEVSGGRTTRQEVVANIILAKEILSEAGCYKKVDGGLGGIGVENWILQNGGNIKMAFERFKASAYDKEGNRLPLDQVKDQSPLYDAGMNIKFNNHDNFMYMLKEPQYYKMLETIDSKLREWSK